LQGIFVQSTIPMTGTARADQEIPCRITLEPDFAGIEFEAREVETDSDASGFHSSSRILESNVSRP
jgi:hypothetical protein